jgi:hypothetical protein
VSAALDLRHVERSYTYTRFANEAAPDGSRVIATWPQIVDALRAASVRSFDRRGWSPATFKADHREASNVERVFVVGLDFDDDEDLRAKGQEPQPTAAELAELFSDFAGVVHSTRKHRPTYPRSRVLLRLGREVSSDEYRELREYFAAFARDGGAEPDETCKDPCRFWYSPSLPAEGEPIVLELVGEAVDVDQTLAEISIERAAAERQAEARRAAEQSKDERERRPVRSYADAALEDACANLRRAPKGERNATLNREAYGLGGLVPHLLAEDRVRAELRSAIAGWDARAMRKHEKTIERGLRAGQADPRHPDPSHVDEEPTGARKKRKKSGDVPPPDGAIVLSAPALADNIDAAVRVLADDPEVFQRDHRLARVLGARPQTDAEARFLPEGTPVIRELEVATLRERLTRRAQWARWDGRSESWRMGCPSGDILAGTMARGDWEGVRHLVGVTESPLLRVDGSVLEDPGWDSRSGWLYRPAQSFPPVPSKPSQSDATAGLALLLDVLADFPYAGEADRHAVIAAILTILGRAAIAGAVPAFLFDASTKGSGKSLTSDVVAKIATGRGAPRMSWPPDDVELEKVLAAYALRGALVAAFDNVATPFAGAPLDKVLTATDAVELRVLGKSEIPTMRWRAVVLATGNNLVVKGDTTRRVLVSRLEPAVERPEDRTGFRHPRLLEYVDSRRGELVTAGLTILRGYLAAGSPDVGTKTWGSFEQWAALVPAAIVWAGGIDPMGCRLGASGEDDPEKAALLALLDGLDRLDPEGRGTKARDLVGRLWTEGRARPADAPPDGWESMREAIEALAPPRAGQAPNVNALGYALRHMRGRVVGGRRLASRNLRGGFAAWAVERVGA